MKEVSIVMNYFLEKQTSDAAKEKPITASELLEEIKLILPDYFVCDFEEVKDGVLIKLYNGQSFTLKVA